MTSVEDLRSLTVKQVAELTGINRRTLDHWRYLDRETGREVGPPWFKVRGVVLYPLPALREWLAAQRAEAGRSA